MKIDSTEIEAPPIEICQLEREDLRGAAGRRSRRARSATFWRMNETPIAVISGARRGALRSGR